VALFQGSGMVVLALSLQKQKDISTGWGETSLQKLNAKSS
jgi:hypothetical protein